MRRKIKPVIFGFNKNGAFVFCIKLEKLLSPGEHIVSIDIAIAEIGVGEYVLIPGAEGNNYSTYLSLETYLTLEMLPGNWSESPLVHWDGEWSSGTENKSIRSKINAYV